MENNMVPDIKNKKYDWPNLDMANGSGDTTRSSKLIALSIKTLGEVIQDLAIVIQEQQNQQKDGTVNG